MSEKFIIPDTKKYLYSLIMDSNIKNITNILKKYKELDNDSKIDLIKEVYVDPDILLKDILEKRNDKEYRLSFDGYCSLNKLISIYGIDEVPNVLWQIRKTCLFWPKHALPTFNTLRSRIPHDRVDYTLYIIKKYFDSNKNPNDSVFYYVIENAKCKDSKEWINSFDSFKEFVDYMGYEHLVENDYSIIDYGTNIIIEDDSCIPPIDKKYIEGLLDRLKKCESLYAE